jgi:hypothetical protein
MLSISCHRCAFSFRFGIKLGSWGMGCHVLMNRDSPNQQAFGVSVLLCSVSNAAPKDVCYISCCHCRYVCCLSGRWLWLFTVAMWCPVHLHKNCTVIRWWGLGAIVSQGTCQTTHAATETLPQKFGDPECETSYLHVNFSKQWTHCIVQLTPCRVHSMSNFMAESLQLLAKLPLCRQSIGKTRKIM